MPEKKKKFKAYLPPQWAIADAAAIQALHRGEATAEQQRRALKFIIEDIGIANEWPFDPDSDRDTHIALGRQFCGKQVIKLLKINLAAIKEKRDDR